LGFCFAHCHISTARFPSVIHFSYHYFSMDFSSKCCSHGPGRKTVRSDTCSTEGSTKLHNRAIYRSEVICRQGILSSIRSRNGFQLWHKAKHLGYGKPRWNCCESSPPSLFSPPPRFLCIRMCPQACLSSSQVPAFQKYSGPVGSPVLIRHPKGIYHPANCTMTEGAHRVAHRCMCIHLVYHHA